MKWISNLFGRHWHTAQYVCIFVLCLILIFGGSGVTSAVSGAVHLVFHFPFGLVRNTVVDLATANAEKERLQELLVETSTRLSGLEEIERENRRLRMVLGFDPPAGYTLLPAKVVSVAGGAVPIAAVINRGEVDSITVDQPLINEQGLIGRIHTVAPNTATVQLLTDPAHRVAVRVAKSREMGIVKYRIGEGLILDNLPIQASIGEGDLVISSGLGGIYPPGLVVGTVRRVVREEDQPFCDVWLNSAANFSSLEEMFILQVVEP
ncbi:rod shape-determining protein MreC [candidate division GN15 bacterium]|nr:rod shape-determining protein MreC [candidate division GN15 bacterium]